MIAPLDWGLGHTTRCVPIIDYIIKSGNKVLFAGNQRQCSYILTTFSGIETIDLKGYNVRYPKEGGSFMWTLAKQLPGIIKTIKEEHEWLQKIVDEHKVDAVISDNRYGLYSESIPSVIMTHQLQPLSGLGVLIDKQVGKLHNKYLQKFDECWVVDTDGENSLAGKLSDKVNGEGSMKYLGLLSQLEIKESEKKGYLMVLLSGPEPQRSVLAEKLWGQLQHHDNDVVFVAGSDSGFQPKQVPEHIEYHKRLNKEKLEKLLSGAALVICRSGYSTLMDLVKLRKKAILIPTPGQTEQEYLAEKMNEDGAFLSAEQSTFDLKTELKLAEQYPFRSISSQNAFSLYQTIVDEWLNKI